MLAFAIVAIFFVSGFENNNIVLAITKVNINTANATELDAIPEVGPSTAAKIIAYRETSGPFLVIEDIMKVSGIKEATFAKMKDFITVGGSSGDTVGTTIPPVDDVDISGDSNNDSDNSDNSGQDSDSTHFEQEELSNYEEVVSSFKVSAGRERVSYVGSLVSFEAKSKLPTDIKNKNVDYLWSFGDGSSSEDEKVIHTYRYPGEYNVVLNAKLNDIDSVARTKVKVLVPNLILSVKPDGAVEILNKSASEINLYGWKLQSDNQIYAFPLDTIISAGKSVIFPVENLKISTAGNQIILADASGKGVAWAGVNLAMADSNQVISTAEFERFAVEYKKLTTTPNPSSTKEWKRETATTTGEEYWSDHYTKATEQALGVNLAKTDEVETVESDGTARSDLAVPAVASVASVQTSPGFWSKIFHPVRTIKETFYK